MSGAASFLNGLAESKQQADAREARRVELEILQNMGRPASGGGYAGGGGATSGGQRRPGGGFIAASGDLGDPVATDLPAEARAFLNSIAHGESAGKYNTRYTPEGGAEFDLDGKHPRIFEKGPHGPSSAAGRYQFTATTWDDMGGGDFGEANQDHMAWKLAQERYGGDLLGDLQNGGLTSEMMNKLAPTWAAYANTGSHDAYIGTYNSSLGRYSKPAEAPKARSIGENLAEIPTNVANNLAKVRSIGSEETWAWTKDLLKGQS